MFVEAIRVVEATHENLIATCYGRLAQVHNTLDSIGFLTHFRHSTTLLNIINNNRLLLRQYPQWRYKTKGLSKLVIVRQCVSRQWMDEDVRELRRVGSIREIGF